MYPTEKALKQFIEYLEQHDNEITDESSQQLLAKQFMEEYNAKIQAKNATGATPLECSEPADADYYMELADNAASKKKKLEYLKKALELEPDNVDIKHEYILYSLEGKPHERLNALQALLQRETEHLRDEGCFAENAGDFWAVLETRPYMRLRDDYMDTLIHLGMIHRAIDEGTDMLRLCENDNLGIRYRLMHLYAYMEDEQNAAALYKKFCDYDETQMLLPLAILYYKLGDEEKAEHYLTRLAACNKDISKFLKALDKNDTEDIFYMPSFGYCPNTYEELQSELRENVFLFMSVQDFPSWASEHLPKRTSKAKK